MPFDPVKAAIFYLLSGLLDAFDGWAARTFNQGKTTKFKCFLLKISLFPFSLILGTSFGAVLDMVTDRYLCYSLSLKPSADHFQYCVHYPGSDIHAGRGLET